MRLAISIALCAGALQGCNQTTAAAVPPDASVPTGWTLISAGTTNLNAVSGVSDSALWVVGDHGVVGHWNGTKLLWETSGTTANLRGVWALTADDAYAVGDAGTILQRTVSGWQQVAAGVTRQVLTGVWADTTRVVAVGSNGTVILGGPMGYKLVPNTLGENLFGVSGTAGGAVTTVGALGLVLQLNGTTLTRTPIPAFTKLLTGVATGSANSYYVGQAGTVYRSDATGLNPVPGCPGTSLRSVSTVGANAWIVGWDGTICEIVGQNATSFPYSDTRWFNGIYAASPTSLWVVGASGTLLHGLPINPDAGAGEAGAAESGAGDGGGP
jgi:photosystem II stability/assembly factor-like uncharacterized protein